MKKPIRQARPVKSGGKDRPVGRTEDRIERRERSAPRDSGEGFSRPKNISDRKPRSTSERESDVERPRREGPRKNFGVDKYASKRPGSDDKPYGKRSEATRGGDYKPSRTRFSDSKGDDRKKTFSDKRESGGRGFSKDSYKGKRDSGNGIKKSYGADRPSTGRGEKRSFGAEKPAYNSGTKKEFSDRPRKFEEKPRRSDDSRETKSFESKPSFDRGFKKDFSERRESSTDRGFKPRRSTEGHDSDGTRDKTAFSRDGDRTRGPKSFTFDKVKKTGDTHSDTPRKEKDDFREGERKEYSKPSYPKKKNDKKVTMMKDDDLMRLNRFVANAGVCSRREADVYIAAGLVTVNGIVVTELGSKVKVSDEVKFNNERLSPERKVYILLNKPKDYVTTVEDPNAEKTVMDLIKDACVERVYPVGRLDRNTTGVLLLTNDGEMTKRLTHPSFGKKKVYHVFLDRNLRREDMDKILEGVQLEDFVGRVDAIEYVDPADKSQIGVELHTGENRIVRRIFEALEYKVKRLDRVLFAGLTKKNLRRGEWRHLTEHEISYLKMQ